MPALPPVPNTLKIEFLYDLNGQPAANILHFHTPSSPIGDAAALAVATHAHGAWSAEIMTNLGNGASFVGVRVTDLTSAMAGSGEYAPAPVVGSLAVPQLPRDSSVVLSHHISRRYRGGHPRTYLPAQPASGTDNNFSWNDAWRATVKAAWDAFVTEMIVSVGGVILDALVNVSYRTGGAPRVAPITDQILSSLVQPRICNQERRLGPLLVE